MIDLAVILKLQKETVYNIFYAKTHLVLCCQRTWPTYASYDEDKLLRKAKQNGKYDGKQIIMWDNPNILFQYKPSGAKNQRLTYSSYYGMNYAKGGVFFAALRLDGCCGALSWRHQQLTLHGTY